MVSEKVMVINPSGIHARPASNLIKTASSFRCSTILVVDEKRIQAKSVLSVMAAGIKRGTEIAVECSGEDEKEALDTIISAIKNGLGERID